MYRMRGPLLPKVLYMIAQSLKFGEDCKIVTKDCKLDCWFVRGRIKEKISTIYAIKYQVYCMENTVQWSANTVQLF